MAYTKRLPETKDIVWLSKLVGSYPANRSEVVRIARKWNFADNIVEFLRQFQTNEIFDNRADFVAKCDDLTTHIRQEWELPKGQIHLVF